MCTLGKDPMLLNLSLNAVLLLSSAKTDGILRVFGQYPPPYMCCRWLARTNRDGIPLTFFN